MPMLSLITFSPLVAAGLILLTRRLLQWRDEAARDQSTWAVGLLASLAVFGLAIFGLSQMAPAAPGFQLVEKTAWIGGVHYHLGVDSVAMLLILLTAFLTPICLFAAQSSIKSRVTEFVVAFLALETFVIGAFAALDIVLFYVFFEGGLIPMFVIIGVWGGANRIYAAYKFFLYTLAGSVLMLIALIAMVLLAGTSDIAALMAYDFPKDLQIWLWLAFFASFAVKTPMFPVHTWLPDAHVEAPTAGSVILAGILLKLGGYGFFRFLIPMFPDASEFFQPLVFALSVIAILYASLVAFRQTDVKKLIAYSSVAHMGFVTLGLFSGNVIGMQAAIFQMLSHGVISGALFLCVGVVYDRMHTREIAFYGGLATRMPIYAVALMLFTLGNVGLPGTSGFVGEILGLTAVFPVSPLAAAAAAFGVILSAMYGLHLYRAMMLGDLVNPKLAAIADLDAREIAVFAPLAFLTLLLGVAPGLVFDFTQQAAAAAAGELAAAFAR
ncbi:MAG TPA: NADH-quinone oxidoreductase subunit M [Hyphomonadaceae bacterium]|nr:NADH-quinone oxidoreductase subunit M [Hyphomonadaceae bacterium]